MRRMRGMSMVGALVLTVLAGGCGSDDQGSTTSAPPASSSAATPATAGGTGLEGVIDAAKAEGVVNLYSANLQPQLDALVEAWERVYPDITLNATRITTNEAITRIDAERGTTTGADVFIGAGFLIYAIERMEETPPGLNRIATSRITAVPDDLRFLDDHAVAVCFNAVGFAWNTSSLPEGIDSFDDLLDPALKGRIGLPEPVAGNADFYTFLEEVGGSGFLAQLAAQEPRFYAGSQPVVQAVGAGEIDVTPFAVPAAVTALEDQGAPIDLALPELAWGSTFTAMPLAESAHPNAAQLLVDFLLSPDGQQALALDAVPVIGSFDTSLGDVAGIRPSLGDDSAESLAALSAQHKEVFGL